MGPDPSKAQDTPIYHPYKKGDYMLMLDGDMPSHNSLIEVKSDGPPPKRLMSTSFNGVWSTKEFNGICPAPRSQHVSLQPPGSPYLFVAYGFGVDNSPLDDFWYFNADTYQWSQIHYKGGTSPRANARAVIVDHYIWFFGGFCAPNYYADLHVFDTETLSIERPVTVGEVPSPRAGHTMEYHDGKIIVWGGYNGDWLSDAYILDLQAMSWTHFPASLSGRVACSMVNHNGTNYLYGAAKTSAFMTFDWNSMEYVPVKGSGDPPDNNIYASLLSFDRYIISYGGKSEKNPFSHFFAFDTIKKQWFKFPVIPDEVTVNIGDGRIDSDGYFMVPRLYACSFAYSPRNREFLLFFGQPFSNPPILSCLSVGDALAVLHLQNDLLGELHF